jgi:predicted transcriptional regulator
MEVIEKTYTIKEVADKMQISRQAVLQNINKYQLRTKKDLCFRDKKGYFRLTQRGYEFLKSVRTNKSEVIKEQETITNDVMQMLKKQIEEQKEQIEKLENQNKNNMETINKLTTSIETLIQEQKNITSLLAMEKQERLLIEEKKTDKKGFFSKIFKK